MRERAEPIEVFSHGEARFIKALRAIGGEAGWGLGGVIVIAEWQLLACVMMAFWITGNSQCTGLRLNRSWGIEGGGI